MSKAALGFLSLTLLSTLIGLALPTEEGINGWLIGASSLFAILFILALAAGRRIKFDPVLRRLPD